MQLFTVLVGSASYVGVSKWRVGKNWLNLKFEKCSVLDFFVFVFVFFFFSVNQNYGMGQALVV